MNLAPIQLALNALKRNKIRSILTMLAISIGIGAVIAIMAAGDGVRYYIMSQLEIYGTDVLSIEIKVPSTKRFDSSTAIGSATGITITTLKDRDLKTIIDHPNISAAYTMITDQEVVSYAGQIKKVLLMGDGYAQPQVEKVTMSSGRFYSAEEEESLAAVAVLGATAREKFFGDADPVGQTIYIRGKPFRVIGSVAKRGSAFFLDMDNIIILPAKTMQKKLLGTNYYLHILAKMKDRSLGESTRQDLEAAIRLNHNIEDPAHDDFLIHTMAEAQSMLGTIASGIIFLLVALVCISLIVGGVGIMNIMYVSVVERTFEIGLRKAVGARNRDILGQFLSEAVMITLGGGVIGIILGAIMSLAIYFLATSYGLKWIYSISLSSIVLAVGFSVFIGLIFGIYPARRAANLNPIEALRRD